MCVIFLNPYVCHFLRGFRCCIVIVLRMTLFSTCSLSTHITNPPTPHNLHNTDPPHKSRTTHTLLIITHFTSPLVISPHTHTLCLLLHLYTPSHLFPHTPHLLSSPSPPTLHIFCSLLSFPTYTSHLLFSSLLPHLHFTSSLLVSSPSYYIPVGRVRCWTCSPPPTAATSPAHPNSSP